MTTISETDLVASFEHSMGSKITPNNFNSKNVNNLCLDCVAYAKKFLQLYFF